MRRCEWSWSPATLVRGGGIVGCRRRVGQVSAMRLRRRFLEADGAAPARTLGVFADEFDTGEVEGVDDPGQTLDHAPHVALARLHALDGGNREPGQSGQRFLSDRSEARRVGEECGSTFCYRCAAYH